MCCEHIINIPPRGQTSADFVTPQLRATELRGGSSLESSRRALETLAQELDRHLAAVGEAAARRGDLRDMPSPSASAAAVKSGGNWGSGGSARGE